MRRLTMKQNKFVNETIQTLNPTEAVRRTYNLGSKGGALIENTARAIASENLTKPAIVKRFTELLNDVNDEEILNRITEILRDDDKRSSLSAADMLLKLKDKYPDQKTKVTGLFGVIDSLKE